MKKTFLSITMFLFLVGGNSLYVRIEPEKRVLAKREISLEKRYSNAFVNDVFKDNILLTMAYLRNKDLTAKDINWDEVRKPFHYELVLQPTEAFAFHGDALKEYKDAVIQTTNANFNAQDGFKSDGYLFGDGVCHLASLINWVGQDANLDVKSPTNHDFATIPEIPRKYGTSIYFNPGSSGANAVQNLYVRNNRSNPIVLVFDYENNTLKLTILELAKNPEMT